MPTFQMEKNVGIGLLCSLDGLILQVLYDGMETGDQLAPGCLFSAILAPECVNKSRGFLEAIQDGRGLDGWNMDVLISGRSSRLFFSGAPGDNRLVIIGAPTPIPPAVTLSHGALLRAGRESDSLAMAIRTFLRGKSAGTRNLYNQVTFVNKELASGQCELIRKNMVLKQLDARKTRLLQMAAHELRHPIGSVLVCTEMMMMEPDPALSDEHQELLESIHSAGEFMLQLLDDILDFSTAKSGNLRFSLERADLVSIVQESVSLNRPLADRKQTELILSHEAPSINVTVDRLKMRTVFDNLIGNAIKFSPNHATVEVRIASQGNCALVSVQDNGPGLPPDELDAIFTGFQKTRARAASSERDTGLGLAIAKQIVDQHGGRIWAESRVGMGATFEVSLSTSPAPESWRPSNKLKRGALRFINHPS